LKTGTLRIGDIASRVTRVTPPFAGKYSSPGAAEKRGFESEESGRTMRQA